MLSRRQTALDSALALAAERGTPLKDLLISITAARQAIHGSRERLDSSVFVPSSFLLLLVRHLLLETMHLFLVVSCS